MRKAQGLPFLRVGLFLLIVVSFYGFWDNALFEQEMWSPLGLRRLGLTAAFFVILALAVYFWKPAIAPHVFLLFLLAYAGATVGPSAPLAVLYFLCSSLFLGRLFFRTDESLDFLQATLLGISLWILLIGVTAHFPINTRFTYLIIFSIPIIAGWRFTSEFYRVAAERVRTAPRLTPSSYAALASLMFLLLMHYLVALKPEVSFDGLAMHMVVASRLAEHSLWPFDVQEFIWAVMPMGGDWVFSGAYLLGGEYAARLLNFSIFGLIVMLLFAAIRNWLSIGTALLLTALFASTPLIQLVTGSLLVENIWAVFVLGAAIAVWRYHTTHRTAYLYLLGIFLGCTIHVKYGSLSLLPATLLLAFLEWRKAYRLRRASSRTLLTFLLVLVVFSVPPYLTAYVKTGNPVYPFLNDLFRSPYYDTTTPLIDARWPKGIEWNTFYTIFFDSGQHLEGQAGSLGFHYLLVSLGFLLLRRKPSYLAIIALSVSLSGWLLTCQYIVYLRYFYPVLPLFMIVIGWVFGEARRADLGLYRMLQFVAAGTIFLNIYFAPASGWWHRDFFVNHFDPDAESDFRDAHAPIRRLVDHLNMTAPGAKVAFLTDNTQIAPLKGPVVATSWHFPEFLRKMGTAGSARQIFALAEELSIEYFVVNSSHSKFRALPEFIKTYTVPEIVSGNYYIARLDPAEVESLDPAESEVILQPNPPGIYDDYDEAVFYEGYWTSSNQFDEAAHDTVTYSNEVGSSFRFVFQGSELTWVYTKAFNRGKASVVIDGRPRGTINLYSEEIEWQTETKFFDLGEGPHELEVRVLGEKNPASSDYFIDVDLLIVK